MSGAIAPFVERYRRALGDQRLRTNLLNFQRGWQVSRTTAFERLAIEAPALGVPAATADWEGAREALVAAKNEVLAEPALARQQFIERATAAGAAVHEAATADNAREVILRLLREWDVRLLAKGKSMVAEEIFLNHHLEAAGIRVVETDLGEWVIQLAHETPSHMVMPAIHKSRQQIADLFEQEVRRPVDHDDVKAMVTLARGELRRAFLQADAGLIGANALVAETGSVMLVTNEGNGDLVSTLPSRLIVIAGWEKLTPSLQAAAAHLRLLARSATGQDITTYTSFITGADAHQGREVHLVLIDNGRSDMWADPDFRDALRCIRCAACADVCPPYQVVGGHVFGHVYSGAIGLVNTPFHHGIDAAAGPQSLCVQCNACASVCPVEIPLPRQILDVRAKVVDALGLPWFKRAAFWVWERPTLFDIAARLAAVAQRPLQQGRFLRVPLPRSHRWRTPPALARTPARTALLGRSFEPLDEGPWAQSNVRGKTVAYFIQCITDRFAPEQAKAAVQVLRSCGARVVVPKRQHCCGLPQLDAGDKPTARRLAKQSIAALERVQADYVVTAAASCAIVMLHDYERLLRDEPAWSERARRLAERTHDLVTFLQRVADPPQLAEDQLAPTLTYHSFCQSTHLLGLSNLAVSLLQRAGLRVADLPEGEVCCGFGGSTSIDHPEVSRWIVDRKLVNARATGARVLASDNPGCILHLRGAAHAARDQFEVRHFVELLAERLSRWTPRTQPRRS
jgi:L-lactate dehydrogenase complex protein LldF